MTKLYKCAIIVHAYKEKYDQKEENSIKNLFSKLGDRYHIYCICPASLDLSYYKSTFSFYKYLRLNDIFFTYPYGYNYMMTNIGFYSYFKDYEYMLIHHPDAWIFNDNLEYWLNKNYVSIGQLLTPYHAYLNIVVFSICSGLCLRKIDYFIEFIKSHQYQNIFDKNYNDKTLTFFPKYFSEDLFLSFNNIRFSKEMLKDTMVYSSDHYLDFVILNNYKGTWGYHGNNKIKEYTLKYPIDRCVNN